MNTVTTKPCQVLIDDDTKGRVMHRLFVGHHAVRDAIETVLAMPLDDTKHPGLNRGHKDFNLTYERITQLYESQTGKVMPLCRTEVGFIAAYPTEDSPAFSLYKGLAAKAGAERTKIIFRNKDGHIGVEEGERLVAEGFAAEKKEPHKKFANFAIQPEYYARLMDSSDVPDEIEVVYESGWCFEDFCCVAAAINTGAIKPEPHSLEYYRLRGTSKQVIACFPRSETL